MPLGSVSPFRPIGTTSLSAASTSTNAPLTNGGESVVVTNPSNTLVFIKFGADPSLTASTSDMPVLPNSKVILSVNSLITYVAAVAPSGTGSILFSRGDGSVI